MFLRRELRSGLLSLFKEKFALKENDIEYRYRDVAVGYVEYGTEKGELPAAYQRHPVGPGGVDDGEIEHIHYFAVQERCVSPSFRKKCGGRIRC